MEEWQGGGGVQGREWRAGERGGGDEGDGVCLERGVDLVRS